MLLKLLLNFILGHFRTETPWIKDEHNRIRIFHGINRIEKNNNYYYDDMLGMIESDKLKI